jgi:hypothetical protein
MKENVIIFAAPSDLSDESAYALCKFFHDIATAVDNHYTPQVERYWKTLEDEEMQPF